MQTKNICTLKQSLIKKYCLRLANQTYKSPNGKMNYVHAESKYTFFCYNQIPRSIEDSVTIKSFFISKHIYQITICICIYY